MVRTYIAPFAVLLASCTVCQPVQAASPKSVVAVFSESDAQFSEIITLYVGGTYQQTETDKKTKLYHAYPDHHPFSQEALPLPGEYLSPLLFGGSKRSGTWRVLDKEGGQPIVFKTLADLPKEAVIEVKGAMPFGITWERQFPYQSHGTRLLPAIEFQIALPAKK